MRTGAAAGALSCGDRARLERYLAKMACRDRGQPSAIGPRPAGAPALLSSGQEQLWLHAQLASDLPIYNEPLTVGYTGLLDKRALERAFNEIIRRHETWRTSFAFENGRPVRVVHPQVDLALPFVDLRQVPEAEREREALRLATDEARRPFDLSRCPLLRATLVQLGENEHRLFLTLHQIIFDGVSMYSVFLPELAALYAAYSSGRPSPLQTPTVQYADYVCWQREWADADRLGRQIGYWKTRLGGAPAELDLPTDRPRPSAQTYRGSQMRFALDRRLSASLIALSRRENVTVFVTLLAAFKVLLYRCTGQDDIVVGTVTSTRRHSDLERLIGFFLNTLVLRTSLAGEPSFRELLRRVREVTLEALSHGDVPVHRLVEEIHPERDPGRSPLFQVMFVMEPPLPTPPPGWTFSQLDVDTGISRTDLYLEFDDRPEGLIGRYRFNRDLFDEATIARMHERFTTLLECCVATPGGPISSLGVLAPSDRATTIGAHQIRPCNPFVEFARGDIEQSIPGRFAKQVQMHSKRVAVRTTDCEWTYEVLDRVADQVALAVQAFVGDRASRVALMLDNDAMVIAGVLGVLKTGSAYVPLDPVHPRPRLEYILRDSQAELVVTNTRFLAHARALTEDRIPVVNVDALQSSDLPSMSHQRFAGGGFGAPVSPDHLAYILYTSGSTGQPKGVMQNHRNVLHFIRAYTNNLHIGPDDRLTLVSSYSVDAAVMDMFGALMNGATLCPIDLRRAALLGLRDELRSGRITIYHSTPTVYRHLLGSLSPDERFPSVRLVVLGGEEARNEDVVGCRKHFQEECLFVNGFGPTEATVALQQFIDARTLVERHSLPVGLPVDDTEVMLLNERGEAGQVRGEIAIRSAHVALGYWAQPGLTEAVFLPDRQGTKRRTYRTGDLGHLLADGSIAYAGRKDLQTKIRGFKVDLSEIETTLLKLPTVKEAAVATSINAHGDSQLVAYVTPYQRASWDSTEWRRFLEERLPDYMVPAACILLDTGLPLTASGKVDRRALSPHDLPLAPAKVVFEQPPSTPIEVGLAKIWSELLERPRIGINENFFELGGHSLLAMRVASRVSDAFGVDLQMRAFFEAPTIAALARRIGGELRDPTPCVSRIRRTDGSP